MTQANKETLSKQAPVPLHGYFALAVVLAVLAGCAVVPPPPPPGAVAFYHEYPPYPATYWGGPQIYLNLPDRPPHYGRRHYRHHR